MNGPRPAGKLCPGRGYSVSFAGVDLRRLSCELGSVAIGVDRGQAEGVAGLGTGMCVAERIGSWIVGKAEGLPGGSGGFKCAGTRHLAVRRVAEDSHAHRFAVIGREADLPRVDGNQVSRSLVRRNI